MMSNDYENNSFHRRIRMNTLSFKTAVQTCNFIFSSTRKMFAMMALIVVGSGVFTPSVATGAPAVHAQAPIIQQCRADLAGRCNLTVQDVKVISAEAVIWPDASLGMPEAGKMYAQVLTPGQWVLLEAAGTRYLYVTSAKICKFGGPAEIWGSSILTLKPIPNEPNLNGDLYQSSLTGTNRKLIVSGVSEFYPQEKGGIIVMRRDSRSGFTMMYVKVGSKSKPVELASGFAFGDARLNAAQTEWAAFMRPGFGAPVMSGNTPISQWQIIIGKPGKKGILKNLNLPEEVRPGQIAWDGEKLMVWSPKGTGGVCYQISPNVAGSEWKEVGVQLFPGFKDMMLNKSETLEINSTNEGGKPGAEIAAVWFTGDKKVLARISNFAMHGYDLTTSGYAVLWGDKGESPAVYTVNIATGAVVPYSGQLGHSIKLFNYPPNGIVLN